MKHLWEYQVNDLLPVRVWYPNAIQFRQFAEVSGDFNLIHLDDVYAKAAGYEGVTAHGMLIMAQMGDLVSNWIGNEGTIRSFRVRLETEVYTDQQIFFTGSLREVHPECLICELTACLADGGRVLSGTAEIGLKA